MPCAPFQTFHIIEETCLRKMMMYATMECWCCLCRVCLLHSSASVPPPSPLLSCMRWKASLPTYSNQDCLLLPRFLTSKKSSKNVESHASSICIKKSFFSFCHLPAWLFDRKYPLPSSFFNPGSFLCSNSDSLGQNVKPLTIKGFASIKKSKDNWKWPNNTHSGVKPRQGMVYWINGGLKM